MPSWGVRDAWPLLRLRRILKCVLLFLLIVAFDLLVSTAAKHGSLARGASGGGVVVVQAAMSLRRAQTARYHASSVLSAVRRLVDSGGGGDSSDMEALRAGGECVVARTLGALHGCTGNAL